MVDKAVLAKKLSAIRDAVARIASNDLDDLLLFCRQMAARSGT